MAAAGLLVEVGPVSAQEMEPRAYSPSPIGTNFLVAAYARTTGRISFDASLPITGVEATINSAFFAYDRTFDLLGQTASIAIALPYAAGEVSGNVGGQGKKVSPSGPGDLTLRLAENLVGSPALTPAEFKERAPGTSLGVSLVVVAPTGNYDAQRLINISSHRWAVKPEMGLSQPIGDWFLDASAGVWLFGDNNDFLSGNVRSQDPLWNFQLHGGYYFRPGLWLSVDGAYYTGGLTSVNGMSGNNTVVASRYGLTLSLPLPDGLSLKLAWSNWLTARNSGNYETVGLALQYRWFDR
jgi:hypothetical protein